MGNARGLEFYLYGSIKTAFLPPLSEETRDNLFFLKTFDIYTHHYPSFMHCEYSGHYLRILYTYEGVGYVKYRKKRIELHAGEGVYIDGETAHEYGCVSPTWVYCIAEIAGPWTSQFYANYSANGSARFSQDLSGFFQAGIEEILTIYNTSPIYRDWQVNSRIIQMLTDFCIYPHENITESFSSLSDIPRLIRYMEENYGKAITVEDLCRHVGLSRAKLQSEFKKYTNIPPIEYLIRLRLKKACEMLTSTKMSCSEIAFSTGFRDVNNFTNLFKKHYGVTPLKYRKSIL